MTAFEAMTAGEKVSSAPVEDTLQRATEALRAARRAGGNELISALAEAAIAYRNAGRRAEAIAAANELVSEASGVPTWEGQLRAAGADILVARFAQEDGDSETARDRLVAAFDRCRHAEERWGEQPAARLFQFEVSTRLAALDLTAGGVENATRELQRGILAFDSAVTAPSLPDLYGNAAAAARLLASNQRPDTAAMLLRCVAEYGSTVKDPLLTARALEIAGDLEEQRSDERAAYTYFQEAAAALDAEPLEPNMLIAASILTKAGLAADHLGEYALAAYMYKRALNIRARILEPHDVDLLSSRHNVAEIARITGNGQRAVRELTAVTDALRDLARLLR